MAKELLNCQGLPYCLAFVESYYFTGLEIFTFKDEFPRIFSQDFPVESYCGTELHIGQDSPGELLSGLSGLPQC